ncbi:hypothetical protein DAT300_20730 [Streptococcus suis]|nr:hypothetical protein DAT300_20730 [Streptococcus suis]
MEGFPARRKIYDREHPEQATIIKNSTISCTIVLFLDYIEDTAIVYFRSYWYKFK